MPRLLASAVEWLAPQRMGRSFRWLLGASAVSNLGDGIALAAGPLLVASQTQDALLVSLAPTLQRLPVLVMGLGVGAYVDRVDRRRLILVVGALRVLVLLALAAVIATGVVTIWLVLLAMLLLGIAETFADIAAQTMLPSIVEPADLAIGNARLSVGFHTLNNLAGPPLGAVLFAAGTAWPFLGTAVVAALALVLVAQIALPPRLPAGGDERGERTSLVADVREGVGWIARHAAIRTLIVTILTFNVTWAAAWGVLVLWAQQRVGLGPVGYGLLTAASAGGSLLAIALFDRVSRRVSATTVMRVCLSLEVLMHLTLALTRSRAVAFATLFVFGLYGFAWYATSVAIRQAATPEHLMGRVSSVNMVGVMGGMVVGMPLGGWLARVFGITAPFWFAFVGSGLTLVLVWRALGSLGDLADRSARSGLQGADAERAAPA